MNFGKGTPELLGTAVKFVVGLEGLEQTLKGFNAVQKAIKQTAKELKDSKDGFNKYAVGMEAVNHTLLALKKIMSGVVEIVYKFAKAMIQKGWKAAVDYEKQLVRVTQAMASVGLYTKTGAQELVDFADSLSSATGIHTRILLDAEGRLLSFGRNINETKRILKLAVEMSITTGTNLSTIIIALQRAVNGSGQALRRYGFDIDDATLQSENFNEILTTLESRFGGQIEARTKTVAGQLTILQDNLEDFYRHFVEVIMPTVYEALTNINYFLTEFNNWFTNNLPNIQKNVLLFFVGLEYEIVYLMTLFQGRLAGVFKITVGMTEAFVGNIIGRNEMLVEGSKKMLEGYEQLYTNKEEEIVKRKEDIAKIDEKILDLEKTIILYYQKGANFVKEVEDGQKLVLSSGEKVISSYKEGNKTVYKLAININNIETERNKLLKQREIIQSKINKDEEKFGENVAMYGGGKERLVELESKLQQIYAGEYGFKAINMTNLINFGKDDDEAGKDVKKKGLHKIAVITNDIQNGLITIVNRMKGGRSNIQLNAMQLFFGGDDFGFNAQKMSDELINALSRVIDLTNSKMKELPEVEFPRMSTALTEEENSFYLYYETVKDVLNVVEGELQEHFRKILATANSWKNLGKGIRDEFKAIGQSLRDIGFDVISEQMSKAITKMAEDILSGEVPALLKSAGASMISAGAKIFSWYAGLGPWAIPAAIGTIAAMVGSFMALKHEMGFARGNAGFSPNNPQQIIVGDNRSENEYLQTKSQIKDNVKEALRELGFTGRNVVMNFNGLLSDGDAYRKIKDIERKGLRLEGENVF